MSFKAKNKPSRPEDYVHDYSLPNFEQEVEVLQWFRDNFTTNPKKLKALATRIRPLVPPHMQTSLVDEIRKSANPVAWMQENFREVGILRDAIEGLVATGHHGMVYDKGVLYGIKLKTLPKWLSDKDTVWTEEQEIEIGAEALKAWMIENGRLYHCDRVLLFQRFGFTGIAFTASYMLTEEEWNQSVKRAEERKAEKTTAELAQLLAMVDQ